MRFVGITTVGIAWLALGSAQTAAQVEVAEYADDTFAIENWTAEKILDTTPGESAQFNVWQQTTGGNPGAWREVFHELEDGTLHIAHLNQLAVYDPAATGEITELEFTYDLRQLPVSGWAVRYRPMLFQDGTYFTSTEGFLIFDGTWTHVTHLELTAVEFVPDADQPRGVDVHPDFSASGAPIVFGYRTSNHSNGNHDTLYSGIDNWRVVVFGPGDPTPAVEATWSKVKAHFR